MPKTSNHRYNVPNKGTENWHIPLNENFEQYDKDIEIRDADADKEEYEPKKGTKFFATDTEKIYLGDGSNWQAVASSGLEPEFESLSLQNKVTFNRAVAIGGNHGIDPRTRLDVRRNISGSGVLKHHVASIQNTDPSGGGDVLALKVSVTNPGELTNFITFLDDDKHIGQLEGDGRGGVNYTSESSDFAEYFPKADPATEYDPGQVVGLRDGEVVPTVKNADAVHVVSTAPIVTGNMPLKGEEDRFVRVALLGQVPVAVSGPVESGDVLVTSPADDGTAVARQETGSEESSVVGLTLNATDRDNEDSVMALVGLGSLNHVSDTFTSPQLYRRLRDVESENQDFHEENERLRAALKTTTDRVEDLEHETERLQAENESLKTRLTALEEQVASMETRQVSPASADD